MDHGQIGKVEEEVPSTSAWGASNLGGVKGLSLGGASCSKVWSSKAYLLILLRISLTHEELSQVKVYLMDDKSKCSYGKLKKEVSVQQPSSSENQKLSFLVYKLEIDLK